MFRFVIVEYGTLGNGDASIPASAEFQLLLESAANTSIRVWLKNYTSLATAKTGAEGLFTTIETLDEGSTVDWVAAGTGAISTSLTPAL